LLDPEYDIAEKIKLIRSQYIANLFVQCDIFDGAAKEDYNLEKLAGLLKEELHAEIDVEAIKELEYDELLEAMIDDNRVLYENKMSVLGEEMIGKIEREIYLKTLDNAWRDHLYQMDNMKTGIRLRAYNQKDPLVEYKKESYNLFTELVEVIKYETIKTLQVLEFKIENANEEAEAFEKQREIEKRQQDMNMTLNHSQTQNNESGLKRPKRNDPCPCGSGKKYKNCCGQSGPKKGVFAS
jgi:preprotein translocase subunit SecA